MAGSERPEWPGVPGLTAEYLAAEDIDISVVLRGIGLSEPRIDTGIRALERVRITNVHDPPFNFRLQHVTEFARGLKLREEGLGRLEEAAFVPLILALLGRGAGALSTFTHVDLTYSNGFPRLDEDSAASLCANLGHKSSKVRNLCLREQWVFGNDQCCEKLAEALRSNICLKKIRLSKTGLGSKGVELLVSGLKENQTLECFDIGRNEGVGDKGIFHVAELLKDNKILHFVGMYRTGMDDEGAGFVSTALARNTKLRVLTLGGNRIGKTGLTPLLELLTPASDAHGPNNTTLTDLELGYLREFPVESMALMIERNTSLDSLDIAKAPLSSDEWVRHIIPALKKNSTLRELYANGSEGVTATRVFEALVDMLKTSNTALELIKVDDTPLSKAGMAGRLAEEIKISKEYRNLAPGIQLEGTDDCYDTNVVKGQKRGVAVLVSMEKYNSGDRLGGAVDRGRLEVLADNLSLEFIPLVDSSAAQLREQLVMIQEEDVLPNDECFVCFLNAHGNTNQDGEHFITDRVGQSILLGDIVGPFRTCKKLRGKPKMFVVNSCRGTNKVVGADAPGPSSDQPAYQPTEGNEKRYVEDLADCLVAFSTFGGSVSARDPMSGTIFVKALVEAFNSKRHNTDVFNIISSVNCAVAHEDNHRDAEGKKVRQCPIVVSSLTKRFFLR